MALAYTSVSRIFDLEPQLSSVTNLTSSQIVTAFAEPAEALINALISTNYDVPVVGTVPLLQALADDISVYRILSRRIFTAQQLKRSVWPDKFKESLDTLNLVAKGQVRLVNSAGDFIASRSDVADVKTNVDTYHSTFHIGGQLDQVIDPDRIDDDLVERDLL